MVAGGESKRSVTGRPAPMPLLGCFSQIDGVSLCEPRLAVQERPRISRAFRLALVSPFILREAGHYPASAASTRAQERMPLWNEVNEYFSLGE